MESQRPRSPRHAIKFHGINLSRKGIIIVGAGSILIICAIVAFRVFTVSQSDPSPTFQTILPGSKTIDQLGGWKRSQPPQGDAIYAFIDTVNGVPVRVSQQPLPESFKNDTASRVAELAKDFNATDKIKDDDITLHIGTSAKGPQWVIFTHNGLLILIKSEKKIADVSWINYVGSLK